MASASSTHEAHTRHLGPAPKAHTRASRASFPRLSASVTARLATAQRVSRARCEITNLASATHPVFPTPHQPKRSTRMRVHARRATSCIVHRASCMREAKCESVLSHIHNHESRILITNSVTSIIVNHESRIGLPHLHQAVSESRVAPRIHDWSACHRLVTFLMI